MHVCLEKEKERERLEREMIRKRRKTERGREVMIKNTLTESL